MSTQNRFSSNRHFKTSAGNSTPTQLAEVLERSGKILEGFNADNNTNVRMKLVKGAPVKTPSIVLYVAAPDGVYYMPIIPGAFADADAFPVRHLDENGMKVVQERSLDEAYDKVLRNAVKTALSTEKLVCSAVAPGTAIACRAIGSVGIGKHIDLDNDSVLAAYIENTALALSEIGSHAEGDKYTVKDIRDEGFVIYNTVDVTPGSTSLNLVGEPIATDITTMITARKIDPNHSKSQVHNTDENIMLAKARAVVDFIYQPPQTQAWQPQSAMETTTPVLVPMLSVTDITGISENGESSSDQETLITAILAMASLAPAVSGTEWVNVFTQNTESKSDLGQVARLYDQQAKRIPEAPGKVKPLPIGSVGINNQVPAGTLHPSEVVNAYCFDQLVVRMDVERGAPNSWILNQFVNAAQGQSKSIDIINSTIDEFTGGEYSKIWGNRNPMVPNSVGIGFKGQYTREDGTIGDLREIDLLKLVEARRGKPEEIAAFNNLRLFPSHANLQSYKKLISAIVTKPIFTGIVYQPVFNNAWFNAILTAISKNNVAINVEGMLQQTIAQSIIPFNTDAFKPIETSSVFVNNTAASADALYTVPPQMVYSY